MSGDICRALLSCRFDCYQSKDQVGQNLLVCMQIAASDALIGKIGYGTVSECLAHGKPLVFVRRDYFNEEPFLRRLLQIHHAAVEIRRRDFSEGNWAPFLIAASELEVTFRLSTFS